MFDCKPDFPLPSSLRLQEKNFLDIKVTNIQNKDYKIPAGIRDGLATLMPRVNFFVSYGLFYLNLKLSYGIFPILLTHMSGVFALMFLLEPKGRGGKAACAYYTVWILLARTSSFIVALYKAGSRESIGVIMYV